MARKMEGNKLLSHVVVNPKVMESKPVIKGTRLTVEYILGLLAHGTSIEDIRKEYGGLTKEDIQACLLYASKSLDTTTIMPLNVEIG